MAENRDDFSPTVKRTLAERVSWMCSYPDCPVRTAGPAKESHDKSIKNGIAAHITAAAPGGPRYDATLTPAQRSDISNGIWLCPSHASIIDKEHNGFKADEIRAWKIAAERRAIQEMESPHSRYSQSEASRYSQKDTATLESYSEVMSYRTIERIKDELFGRFVSDEVTNPLHQLEDMRRNPRFQFRDPELEELRQRLHSQVLAFFIHFG